MLKIFHLHGHFYKKIDRKKILGTMLFKNPSNNSLDSKKLSILKCQNKNLLLYFLKFYLKNFCSLRIKKKIEKTVCGRKKTYKSDLKSCYIDNWLTSNYHLLRYLEIPRSDIFKSRKPLQNKIGVFKRVIR